MNGAQASPLDYPSDVELECHFVGKRKDRVEGMSSVNFAGSFFSADLGVSSS